MFNLRNKHTGQWLVKYTGRYNDTAKQADALVLDEAGVADWHHNHGHQYEAVKAPAVKAGAPKPN